MDEFTTLAALKKIFEQYNHQWFGENVWILQSLIVIVGVLVLTWGWRKFSLFLVRRFDRAKINYDHTLFLSIMGVFRYTIWIMGGWVLLKHIAHFSWLSDSFLSVITIGLVVWALIRFMALIEDYLLKRIKRKPISQQDKYAPRHVLDDVGSVITIAKLLRFLIVIVFTLIGLHTLGVNMSAALAFGGVGGIAVGFAAKDLLANFFGGLMIYLDRPFTIGDWIRSPDRNIEGVVENIGWRQTRIRTFDKRPLYVPNSLFANISVENPSRMKNRRIYETIGIRYDDFTKIDAIVQAIEHYLKTHQAIDTQQTLMVNFNQFGPSSLDFFIYVFTKTTDWCVFHQVKHAILVDIGQIIIDHGAEIAFPTQTLHIHREELS